MINHPETGSVGPMTLFALAGAAPRPASLAEAVLLIVDAQKEYVTGRLPLHGVDTAVAAAADLLAAARNVGAPVVHVVHQAVPGSFLFDPETSSIDIIEALAPLDGEPLIVKRLPNAFTGTDLAENLTNITAKTGRRALMLIGFMTHNCVSATVRGALDLGFLVTVVANATATRDLWSPLGGMVAAEVVQQVELAALADRSAVVVRDANMLPASPPFGLTVSRMRSQWEIDRLAAGNEDLSS